MRKSPCSVLSCTCNNQSGNFSDKIKGGSTPAWHCEVDQLCRAKVHLKSSCCCSTRHTEGTVCQ